MACVQRGRASAALAGHFVDSMKIWALSAPSPSANDDSRSRSPRDWLCWTSTVDIAVKPTIRQSIITSIAVTSAEPSWRRSVRIMGS